MVNLGWSGAKLLVVIGALGLMNLWLLAIQWLLHDCIEVICMVLRLMQLRRVNMYLKSCVCTHLI